MMKANARIVQSSTLSREQLEDARPDLSEPVRRYGPFRRGRLIGDSDDEPPGLRELAKCAGRSRN